MTIILDKSKGVFTISYTKVSTAYIDIPVDVKKAINEAYLTGTIHNALMAFRIFMLTANPGRINAMTHEQVQECVNSILSIENTSDSINT